MKTITKLASGIFVASALMLGCAAGNVHAQSVYLSTETTETVDLNGNKTSTTTVINENGDKVTTTTDANGKTSTKTEKAIIKTINYTNQTKLDFKSVRIKTDTDNKYQKAFNDTLEAGYNIKHEGAEIGNKFKTVTFEITDSNGQKHVVEGLDATSIQEKSEVTFVFEQDSDGGITVGIAK